MTRWRTALVVFGLWTLFGLWSAQQYILLVLASGREVESWARPFEVYLTGAWLWAAFTPAIALAVRGLPTRGPRVALTVLGHASLFVAMAALDTLWDVHWYAVLVGQAPRPFLPAALTQSNTNLFSYLVVATAVYALGYYRAYRERTLAATQLATQLARTQLRVLRSQLHPHFLFNTLNGIAALMHRDVAAADRMLTRLSELLRTAIDTADLQEVPVLQELAFTEGYLEIERTRFSDRLTVTVHVDPEVRAAAVPHLLLQPIVENAVRHGIAPRAGAGRIALRVTRENGNLVLAVTDDGVGRANAGDDGTGLGITRERLRHLYGDAAVLEVGNRPEGGFAVTIAIPFRVIESGVSA